MHQGVEKRDTTAFPQKRFPTPVDWFAQGEGGILEVLADPEKKQHSPQHSKGLGARGGLLPVCNPRVPDAHCTHMHCM